MGDSTANCGPGREMRSIRFASNASALNRRDDDTLLTPISSGV